MTSMITSLGRLRALATSARSNAAFSQSTTTTNGDPGPQAARFRKSQRKAMREGRGTKVLGGLDDLDRVFDAAPTPRDYQNRRSNSRERSGPPGRFNNGRSPIPAPTDPFGTSLRLKRIIQPRSGPMTSADVEKAIKMVMETPRDAVSVPVWNMLLGMIGREGRLELMWKTFNDMKKRSFKPNSRTYTTLLNAYAGIRHSADTSDPRGSRIVEPKTLSRVSIIYDQAETYMAAAQAELERAANMNDPEELGLATDAMVEEGEDGGYATDVDVSVGPTNAYLKFLARYGMFKEMDKVFLALPTTGPLSPDIITYTTMFSALYDDLNRRGRDAKSGSDRSERSMTNPSGLWTRMCRQYSSTDDHVHTGADGLRSIDESVVLIALKCLSRGDQSSQRTTMDIIDTIWSLPRPSSPSSYNATPVLRGPTGSALPKLPLSIRAATTIMSVCPKPTDRSHYAQLFLDRDELRKEIDTPFLIAAIRALSETGDIETVQDILDNYQPRQPNHWPLSVWHDALTAARWSKSEDQGLRSQPDFQSALKVFRRMTHLPAGVEDGEREGTYEADSPNGKSSDMRGIKWARSPPIEADPKSISLLIKIALGRGWREVEQAVNVYQYLQSGLSSADDGQGHLQGRRAKMGGKRQWDLELAKDVERACERLLEREWPKDKAREYEKLKEKARRVQQESESESE